MDTHCNTVRLQDNDCINRSSQPHAPPAWHGFALFLAAPNAEMVTLRPGCSYRTDCFLPFESSQIPRHDLLKRMTIDFFFILNMIGLLQPSKLPEYFQHPLINLRGKGNLCEYHDTIYQSLEITL